MKIKRFFAEDIRQAMRMVKEELGADAVIMSNKSVDGGVEIVAARDFDEQLIQSKLHKQQTVEQQPPAPKPNRFANAYGASSATGQRDMKKMELPDFEAEKNRLHVISSSRKQNAESAVFDHSSARPNRFANGNEQTGLSGIRSNRFASDYGTSNNTQDGRSNRFSDHSSNQGGRVDRFSSGSDTSNFQGGRSNRFPTDSDTPTIHGGRSNRFPNDSDTPTIHGSRSNRLPADSDTPAIHGGRRNNTEQYVGYAEKVHLRGKQEPATTKVFRSANSPVRERPVPTTRAAEKPADRQSHAMDSLLLEMSKELKSLRSAMDSKLSTASMTGGQVNTIRGELMQRLAGMSISRKLSVKIVERFADHNDIEEVFDQAQELLTKVLPVAEDDLLQHGGIAALVGPTGVGKTTTIAKLAAKFILKHGPRQVALITTDNYRIGAHEQLNTYGRILDIPVRVASSAAELRNLINGFADKRLILIDTAGMSQRGMKLVEQITTLQESGLDIKSYLVMSAATEYKAMNEIISAFNIFEPHAAILTKLDEAATVGSAISSIIEHNLPLSFIANGQQVPEDMHIPCAATLVAQCVAELEEESDYNDEDNEAWVAQGYA